MDDLRELVLLSVLTPQNTSQLRSCKSTESQRSLSEGKRLRVFCWCLQKQSAPCALLCSISKRETNFGMSAERALAFKPDALWRQGKRCLLVPTPLSLSIIITHNLTFQKSASESTVFIRSACWNLLLLYSENAYACEMCVSPSVKCLKCLSLGSCKTPHTHHARLQAFANNQTGLIFKPLALIRLFSDSFWTAWLEEMLLGLKAFHSH